MSIVMPAGKSTLNWSPIIKQASAGGKPVVQKDELYEAAKKVVKAQFDASQFDKKDDKSEVVEESPIGGDMGEVGGDVGGEASVDGALDGAVGEAPVGEIPGVVTDDVAATGEGGEGGAEGAIAKAQDALSQAQTAIDEVAAEMGIGATDDAGGIGGVGGDEEVVEIEIEDGDEVAEVDLDEKAEGDAEVEIDVDKTEPEGEIVKESKDDDDDKGESDKCEKVEEKCNKAEKKGEEKEASVNGFVKISALTPKVRKKLYNFWANELGYDKDYCKLLVTDYEK